MNTTYNTEYPKKTATRCTKQMISSFHFFNQISSAYQSMQGDQGYPLMTSDLVGKPSIVPKAQKTLRNP